MTAGAKDWRQDGVRVISADDLDGNTPQTPGMYRQAAVTGATAGAAGIWAGTVTIEPGARTGPHHHGELESVIYVLRGHAQMRWGEELEWVTDAGPGDFIFVPAFVPHQEINADPVSPLECILARNGQEAVVVNLDIEPAESPSRVPPGAD